jgi:hypothetical protein
MTIHTVKELKEFIKDLPDDMLVLGYKGGNGDLYCVDYYTLTEDTLTEEELREGYPDGVTPTLVVDVD